MWNVLRLYGIGDRLLRGVKSLYVGSKACVREGNEVSEWFPVRVGLRQGCVMSPWLFNLLLPVPGGEKRMVASLWGMRSVNDLDFSVYFPYPLFPLTSSLSLHL